VPEPARATALASRLFASIGAASAIIVAVCSLGITLYEARITREHQKLSVWPRLAMSISDSGGVFTRTVVNNGLGPALVRSYQVTVDGKPMASWTAVLRTLMPAAHGLPYVYSSFGRGSVLLPGAQLNVLTVSTDSVNRMLREAEPRVGTTVCYCSLYNECWVARSGETDPVAIDRCDEASKHELAL
jgi:hypothetical protein